MAGLGKIRYPPLGRVVQSEYELSRVWSRRVFGLIHLWNAKAPHDILQRRCLCIPPDRNVGESTLGEPRDEVLAFELPLKADDPAIRSTMFRDLLCLQVVNLKQTF